MRKILIVLGVFFSLSMMGQTTQEAKMQKMGVQIGVDSSSFSGRTFLKRLFVQKGTWGFGLQGTYLSTKGSDSNILMLLTGLNGGISYGSISPSVSYAYAPNLACGVRLNYTGADGVVDEALFDLMNDGLSFPLSGLQMSMRSVGLSLFHRFWMGLDDRGRCALFLDGVLSASRSRLYSGGYTDTRRYALSLCPGFEVFVMNFLSLQLSLGLASGYFVDSKVYDNAGTQIGGSRDWKAGTGLNLLDLNFGLTFYL